MRIGIFDAELVGNKKHRFPNLACMKISAYHKNRGDWVCLLLDYRHNHLDEFDKIYISKVFTKTDVPQEILDLSNVQYGGTGFFYDKAEPLPYEIEHCMPDYHLYDDWVNAEIAAGKKKINYIYFLDYSIGYLTRGCFRQCSFCVNQNCKQSLPASPLAEFMDIERPKLCFLDDNFFACKDWQTLIESVVQSGKRFQFKQGLDERLLTEDKILALSQWKYDKEVIFAFDNIEDLDLICDKLEFIQKVAPNWKREKKFYVLCGYDRDGKYDNDFWEKDIRDLFVRIFILVDYGCKPYIMRYKEVYNSEYSAFYSAVAAWCNQPNMFKTFTFREFAQCRGMRKDGYKKYKRDINAYLTDIGIKGSEWRAMEMVAERYPEIAKQFDRKINRGK